MPDPEPILIFGGTFDPPHLAHVRLPEMARQAIGADHVLYIPTAQQPLKQGKRQTPAHHRLAMLRLALADQPHTRISTDELDRAGDGRPSYTLETLERLKARWPEAEFRLLIGADQLRLFPKWKGWERIIELAEPVVMVRPPDSKETLLEALPPELDRSAWRPRLLDLPQMDVSATEIRRRVREGLPIDEYVKPEVARYIEEHGLYRDDEENCT